MNNSEVSALKVGGVAAKEVRKGSQLVLAPNGDQLWYKANTVPSLDLRFADSKSLVDATTGQNLVTFTRASSGTYVDSEGVIRTATTNLRTFSEDFANAAYSVSTRLTVTADAIVAPNGTTTADKLVATLNNDQKFVETTASVISSFSYAFGMFAKKGEYEVLQISVANTNFSGTLAYANFNLNTGTIVSSVDCTPSIQAIGDGWFRCSVIMAAATGTGANAFRFSPYTSGNPGRLAGYTGDGTSGIYLWGAQLEQSTTVGEYIPTTSTINSAPRFDHRVTSTTTNLLLRSEEFETTWVRTAVPFFGSGSFVNTEAAPNGTLTADLVVVADGSDSGTGFISQDITKAATATTYTLTVFAKAQNWNAVTLQVNDAATNNNRATVTFSLATGVITIAAAAVGTFSAASAAATSFGNGWFRASLTFTSSTETGLRIRIYPNNSTTVTGNGSDGIYIWGAQLEQSSTVGEYVPTTTAAVTVNTTESLGLLVEEQRANLLQRSEEFDDASWTNSASLVTANTAVAPNGTLTADTLTPDVLSLYQAFSNSIATYTSSIFVKSAGATSCTLSLVGGLAGLNGGVTFSFASNTESSFGTVDSVSSQPFGNGWYRVTATLTATGNASPQFRLAASGGDVYIWGAQLEAGSKATSYIPTTDATATRAADLARISGSNFGVSRTNLLLRSEEFDNASWIKGANTIVTANYAVAPNGTTTADRVEMPNSVGTFVNGSATVVSGLTYTFSVYARATAATSAFEIGLGTNTASHVLTAQWQRYSLSFTATGSSLTAVLGNGNNAVDFLAWGAQLETGSTATAYIPTTTAAVTVVESPWYRQDEGTVFVDFNGTNITSGQFPRLLEFNDGTSNNSIRVQQYNAGANAVRASVVTAAVTQFAADNGSVAVGVRGKTAFGSALNDAALVTNGASPTTDATYLVPSELTQLGIGGPPTAPTSVLNSTIRRLTYWPQRLSNITLQQITQ